MSKPVCFMLVGMPGSGKSTWAKEQGLPVVSSDAWVEKLAAERGLTYTEGFDLVAKEAMAKFNQEIDQMVREKRNFIWDQTNLSMGSRASKLRRLRGYDAVAEVWVLPDAELVRRQQERTDKVIPADVLRQMVSQFSVPSIDEGFKEVIVHRE